MDDDMKKCSTCRKILHLDFFPPSSKCCEKCVAYRIRYNEKKKQERASIPGRFCDLCCNLVKLEHWDNHYNLPSHIIKRLTREYQKNRPSRRKGKNKTRTRNKR